MSVTAQARWSPVRPGKPGEARSSPVNNSDSRTVGWSVASGDTDSGQARLTRTPLPESRSRSRRTTASLEWAAPVCKLQWAQSAVSSVEWESRLEWRFIYDHTSQHASRNLSLNRIFRICRWTQQRTIRTLRVCHSRIWMSRWHRA
mgnify:CR=1 FL=1